MIVVKVGNPIVSTHRVAADANGDGLFGQHIPAAPDHRFPTAHYCAWFAFAGKEDVAAVPLPRNGQRGCR